MTGFFEWASVILGSGAVGSVVTSVVNRKKHKADAASTIAQTAVTLLAPLQSQVRDLLKRVEKLEDENAATKEKLGHAETRLEMALGHIKQLRRWIAEHLPDKTPPPPPIQLEV